MKVVAIVQARMGSNRLPGKVLKDICGKPMLWHIIRRLKECKYLSNFVIATSTNKLDNAIESFSKKNCIKIFRGDETDVLKRYIDAGENEEADYIVRVTADAPLIEPSEIDRLIKIICNKKADFILNAPGIDSVHEGFCVVSLKALKKIHALENIKDYHKEHVTLYLKENPGIVKTVYFKPLKVFQCKGYRLSIDNMADLTFIRTIYQRLWDKKNIVDLKKVLNFLKLNHEIKAINCHVSQKNVSHMDRIALFIIDGGEKFGYGHFTRSIQIAKYLTECKNYGTVFLVNNKSLYKKTCECGFKTFFICAKKSVIWDYSKIEMIFRQYNPHIAVIDVCTTYNVSGIIKVLIKTNSDIKVALIDNFTDARFLANINIYPVPKLLANELDWGKYTGKVYRGLKFFPLKKEFIDTRKVKKETIASSILISMGGSDPNNVTPFLMKQLVGVFEKIKVIIGPGFKNIAEIKSIAKRHKDIFELYENPSNYPEIVVSCSCVITALGIAIYEFSFLKVKMIVVGNYLRDKKVGECLQNLGYCKYLGYYRYINRKLLIETFSNIEKLSKFVFSREIPDSKGVKRLVALLVN